MAFGAIELTTISRAQDYTTIKHNEDNKVAVDQTNFSDQVQKAVEQNIREVHTSDNAQWRESRPDAKEKGKGEYRGDGGRKRKGKQAQDRVVVKNHGGFDMKI
ncbi:MAG: hypothetical protein HFH84_01290 [Lachnospiraceae bacterium]|jgi:hypothetical protein|nr:hypothetical protein [Lachnospiraceae bacterium]